MYDSEDDFHRAKLSENLWEEGGGQEPSKRHSQIFREFLKSMGTDKPDQLAYTDFTKDFVRQYLRGSASGDPLYGAAFLSLGTEGIVADMYTVLVDGMLKAGLPKEWLKFFYLHIGCDDDHAETLKDMLYALRDRKDFIQTARQATDDALNLRTLFFNNLYETCKKQKLSTMKDLIHGSSSSSTTTNSSEKLARESKSDSFTDVRVNRNSLEPVPALVPHDKSELLHLDVCNQAGKGADHDFTKQRGHPVYKVNLPTNNISFSIGDIAPGEKVGKHRHGYESIVYVIEGQMKTVIDGMELLVKKGDCFYIPNWSWHQHYSHNNTFCRYLTATNLPLMSRLGQTVIRQEESDLQKK
jgi:quercetin dioxygenase-like cupin family protein